MKRLLIGLLSALLVATSIFGASSKGPRDRRAAAHEPENPEQILFI
jgi:hypothetical protein